MAVEEQTCFKCGEVDERREGSDRASNCSNLAAVLVVFLQTSHDYRGSHCVHFDWRQPKLVVSDLDIISSDPAGVVGGRG